MKKLLKNLLGDSAGASAAEYALILAVFGGAVVIGVTALGDGFKTQMTNSKTLIEKDYSK
ncbi:Flp family type IVb pilin [Sandaracinobacteroides hominis]|uniref:Flp family type IVb pilin n=1 Tax=Sandaracinobacteroides hominis TaxID=2780086 RepID=UPI0018F4A879|nr:Flp family type IVb pilin [Sandaracinobacteroides hominis]